MDSLVCPLIMYVINGCDELFVHVSLLFSSMLVHGFAFDDLLISSIHSSNSQKENRSEFRIQQLPWNCTKFHFW